MNELVVRQSVDLSFLTSCNASTIPSLFSCVESSTRVIIPSSLVFVVGAIAFSFFFLYRHTGEGENVLDFSNGGTRNKSREERERGEDIQRKEEKEKLKGGRRERIRWKEGKDSIRIIELWSYLYGGDGVKAKELVNWQKRKANTSTYRRGFDVVISVQSVIIRLLSSADIVYVQQNPQLIIGSYLYRMSILSVCLSWIDSITAVCCGTSSWRSEKLNDFTCIRWRRVFCNFNLFISCQQIVVLAPWHGVRGHVSTGPNCESLFAHCELTGESHPLSVDSYLIAEYNFHWVSQFVKDWTGLVLVGEGKSLAQLEIAPSKVDRGNFPQKDPCWSVAEWRPISFDSSHSFSPLLGVSSSSCVASFLATRPQLNCEMKRPKTGQRDNSMRDRGGEERRRENSSQTQPNNIQHTQEGEGEGEKRGWDRRRAKSMRVEYGPSWLDWLSKWVSEWVVMMA